MVRKALRLESWNRGSWEEVAIGDKGQAFPFTLSEGKHDRNVLVMPCTHLVDEPTDVLGYTGAGWVSIVVCQACKQRYLMRWDREGGTWTTTRV
jgi:hypothetical protein